MKKGSKEEYFELEEFDDSPNIRMKNTRLIGEQSRNQNEIEEKK